MSKVYMGEHSYGKIKILTHNGGRNVYVGEYTSIGDGVVVAAGAILTKNPEPYEIWGGNPAIRIGVR
jgi:UDP-3-O-[3-hydroxymyristoyl] glucosamine N-acyltransferase